MLAMLLLADVIYVQSGEGLKWFAVDRGVLTEKGALSTPGHAPIYLRPSPEGRVLYAAGRDRLLVFAIGDDAALTSAGEAPSPGGPCYVDATGRWIATANYGAGTTLLYPAAAPRTSKAFSTGPQSHAARFHEGHLYALSVAGRKITRISVEDGATSSLDMPGLGPRHVAFSGGFAFVVHERPIRVSTVRLDPLESIGDWAAQAPGAPSRKELAAAEIAVSGRFVVASVRDFSKEADQNGLAVFSADLRTGVLTWVEFVPSGGVSPRGFVIDPAGAFLYVLNELSGTLATFRIDPENGRLKPVGDALKIGAPAIGIAYVGGRK
jgi:6-phosphogluconolactonase